MAIINESNQYQRNIMWRHQSMINGVINRIINENVNGINQSAKSEIIEMKYQYGSIYQCNGEKEAKITMA
jgi:hypothetical protein